MTFFYILLLAASGFGGVYYYNKVYRQSLIADKSKTHTKKRLAEKKSKESTLDLQNVGKGAVLGLMQIGPEFEDFDVTITAKHLVKQGAYRWTELDGETGDRKVSISIDTNDDLKIQVTLKELKLRHIGIVAGDLEKFSNDQSGSIEYEGKKFFYSDEDSAKYCANENELETENFRFMDFATDDESEWLTVSDWDGSIEVSYSVAVKSHQVTVYSI